MSKENNHFKTADPILYQIILKVGKIQKRKALKTDQYFERLVESIVSQQLSVKVSDVIYERLLSLVPNRLIIPENILSLKDEQIRKIGISFSKIKYIKDLAEKVFNGEIDLKKLNQMSDEEVVIELVKVKGIGQWTAEMFLMSSLAREDIFSHGDLGLKNAIKKIYNLENPSREDIEEIISNWSPYKTYACRVLWMSLDLKDESKKN